MRRAIVCGWVVVLATAAVAAASEQSKLLYSRGLVELHADRFEKALALFDRAVAADGTDIYARYYRAVTRGRLNDTDGAIADLQAVLLANADFDQAALDLGVALVQSGRSGEAVPWLTQARRTPDLEAQASLFLGIAQLRVGELAAAQTNFARAMARDPKQTLAARYYQGVAAYQAGTLGAAADHFTYVATASPGSVMGGEAKTFLEQIHATQAKPQYHLYASAGFQYDSNVQLAPSDTVIKGSTGIGKQSDGRGTLSFGGTDVVWHNDSIRLLLGYDFYQSLHFSLTQFNLQDHGPSADLWIDAGAVQLGLYARYDYYLLESDSFLQEATLLPSLTVPEQSFGRTELYSRLRRRDFKKAAFGVRDAFNDALGIRQVIDLGSADRYVSVGYQFDREDPVINTRLVNPLDAKSFGYDGNEANVGIGWMLPGAIGATGSFAYRRERYKPESGCAVAGDHLVCSAHRNDDELLATVALTRQLTDALSLTLAYLGNYNNSNKPLFDYDRSIASVAMEVRF